jgi:uncharacterized protein (TIGR02118 family)
MSDEPMRVKMIYLARRNRSLPAAAFPARWLQHGAFCRGTAIWDRMCRYQQCLSLDGDVLPGIAVATDWDGVGIAWFRSLDAFQQATADPARESLGADAAETFDGPTDPLLAHEHVVFDRGGTRVKVIAFVRRRPGLTQDEFSTYWREHHAPLVMSSPELSARVRKYVQNHTLQAAGDGPAEWDGVMEMGFECLEDLATVYADEARLRIVRADHARFMDTERMVVVATHERLLYEDALGDHGR